MRELIETHLEALKVLHYAPATIKSHRQALAIFEAYLTERGISDVREVTRDVVRDFQLQLTHEKPKSICNRIGVLRSFFKRLEKADLILVNPCDGIPLPQIKRRIPEVLTRDEARQLLDAPDPQTKVGLRDKAILEVLYSTGLRLQEMARLTIHDVDCKNGFVRVNKGKGGKDRVVPLGKRACDSVREYLQQVRSLWTKENRDERALWLNSRTPHDPIRAPKVQMIQIIVRKYAQLAGIKKRVTPHVWRHTCATHLVANGSNIAYVQRLLGHRRLQTTEIYTRSTIADVKTTHRQKHPRTLTQKRQRAATP